MNLQRLKAAADREKELEYQERILKARLQSMGIHTEELDIIWFLAALPKKLRIFEQLFMKNSLGVLNSYDF